MEEINRYTQVKNSLNVDKMKCITKETALLFLSTFVGDIWK